MLKKQILADGSWSNFFKLNYLSEKCQSGSRVRRLTVDKNNTFGPLSYFCYRGKINVILIFCCILG